MTRSVRKKASLPTPAIRGKASAREYDSGSDLLPSGPQRATIRSLTGHAQKRRSVVLGKRSKQGGYRNVATERNACRFAAGAVGASPRGRRRKREVVDDLWRRHSEYALQCAHPNQ